MRTIIILFFAVCVALAVVNYVGLVSLTTSENLEILILSTLAITTFWYAKSTKELSETTNKSYDLANKSYGLAVETEMSSVLPFVTLIIQSVSSIEIRVLLRNDGRGPATNLRAWVNGDDSVFDYLRSDSSKRYLPAIGVDKMGYTHWNNNRGVLPDYSSGFDIIAEYEDVFGRSFRSKLQVIDSNDEEFSFIKLSND